MLASAHFKTSADNGGKIQTARTNEETSGFVAEKRQVSLTELICSTWVEILNSRDLHWISLKSCQGFFESHETLSSGSVSMGSVGSWEPISFWAVGSGTHQFWNKEMILPTFCQEQNKKIVCFWISVLEQNLGTHELKILTEPLKGGRKQEITNSRTSLRNICADFFACTVLSYFFNCLILKWYQIPRPGHLILPPPSIKNDHRASIYFRVWYIY